MPKYKLPIEDRFKDKYEINESGCWEWNGALCVNPEHLFLGTKGENLEDAIAKGRRYKSICPSTTNYKKGCRCDGCKGLIRQAWLKRKLKKRIIFNKI
jgi:hypothetical protein